MRPRKPLQHWWHRIGDFVRDRRGNSLVELAIAAPILMLILLGTFDMAQYILLHQKLNRSAAAMADLISQSDTITATEVDQLFSAAQHLAVPFNLPARGRVIVSSITRPAGENASIGWQRDGGGSLSATSELGNVGGTPNLPTGLSVREGENLIVAEVFYTHAPILLSEFVSTGVIRHVAFRRARLSELSTLN